MARKPKVPGDRPPGGPGWGGPKKGIGVKGQPIRPAFEKGNKAASLELSEHARLSNAQRRDILMQRLWDLSGAAENEATKMNSTVHYLNRLEGLPVARNINVATDDLSTLDDASLTKRREELERAIRAASEGEAPETDTDES